MESTEPTEPTEPVEPVEPVEPSRPDHAGARIVGGVVNLSGPGPQVIGAASLCGDKVINRRDEELGEIADIMIDIESGRVAYAALSFGGVLGLGSKFFAIPWHAFTLDADRHCFILDIERERFNDAPGFDKDHWPSTADPAWASDIHSYHSDRGRREECD